MRKDPCHIPQKLLADLALLIRVLSLLRDPSGTDQNLIRNDHIYL